MLRPRLLAVLGAALVLATLAPLAAATTIVAGPLAFYFVSASCSASNLTPPGLFFVQLTQATGLINGQQVTSSPSVSMVLSGIPPAGYIFCESYQGQFRSYGDGVGYVVAA
jgi:hypothetical protein